MDSKRAVTVISELEKWKRVGSVSSVLWKGVLFLEQVGTQRAPLAEYLRPIIGSCGSGGALIVGSKAGPCFRRPLQRNIKIYFRMR